MSLPTLGDPPRFPRIGFNPGDRGDRESFGSLGFSLADGHPANKSRRTGNWPTAAKGCFVNEQADEDELDARFSRGVSGGTVECCVLANP